MEADEYNVTQAIAVERELVDLKGGARHASGVIRGITSNRSSTIRTGNQ